jgi:two-component system, chemotaxis family, chemotaxis protein CheY
VAGDQHGVQHPSHQVLIVDDYDDTRDALAAVLSAHGWDVASAWSVEDAMRHFREGLRPCVVLLDLRMPGVDGWALWERMKNDPDLAGIAVVLCSGDVEQQQRAAALGIREFVRKPVDPDQLLAVVANHCVQRPRT